MPAWPLVILMWPRQFTLLECIIITPPLLVKWLTLTARFWVRVRGMPPGRLVREALVASI